MPSLHLSGHSMLYHRAEFLTSAAKLNQLPPDAGVEVAFAGRSNAGKSSALNALTNQKSLAKTSKTPGRTQMINLFGLDPERRLVDLPGYGFAKVSKSMKEDWQKTLSLYLQQRKCLKGLVILSDIRHPLKDTDQQLVEWAQVSSLPVHLLLSKSDKLKSGAQKKALMGVEKILNEIHEQATVQTFSAARKNGLPQLAAKLDQWFGV